MVPGHGELFQNTTISLYSRQNKTYLSVYEYHGKYANYAGNS